MRTLRQINAVYEYIIHSDLSDRIKALKLSKLMMEMERGYGIPMIRDRDWEKENKAVVAMYRKISRSRNL